MAWVLARNLSGAFPQQMPATAGGVVAVGDPLVWSSGKLVKATGGDTAEKVVAVATKAAAADGDAIMVHWATRETVWIGKASGTIVLGVAYNLHATTLLPDQGTAKTTNTTGNAICIGRDEIDTTLYYWVATQWLQ